VIVNREKFLEVFEAYLIDEAHELRKSSMMILAILKNFIKSRGIDHKMIVTSATLDTAIFQKYFSGMKCQTIEAKTPTYDVEEHYTYFPDLSTSIVENTAAHLRYMFEHLKNNFGKSEFLPNILVFLPSIKEIKQVKEFIEKDYEGQFRLIANDLPFHLEEMHGGLRPSEKDAVLKPPRHLRNKVRVILATKIAETALTLEDIYYVLDSGRHTEYFYDEVAKMDYHKEVPISKSSAIQRRGRAGRIANGFCFKMYTQEDEAEFEDTNIPEILRMDIADVIMTQIDLKDMFLMSDLLYYDQLVKEKDKISQVSNELLRIGATEIQNDKNGLTNKGKFMTLVGLKGLTGAFLYECIKLGVRELGEIASTALESKNLFRNNVGFGLPQGTTKEFLFI
jgi:ATP-dependent helicase HrpA